MTRLLLLMLLLVLPILGESETLRFLNQECFANYQVERSLRADLPGCHAVLDLGRADRTPPNAGDDIPHDMVVALLALRRTGVTLATGEGRRADHGNDDDDTLHRSSVADLSPHHPRDCEGAPESGAPRHGTGSRPTVLPRGSEARRPLRLLLSCL